MRWMLVLVAGCAYHPGSYADYGGRWSGTRVELGCVELAVAREGSAVIHYKFGNRCEHRVTLDLASVRVVARGADGREVALRAYDPREEIHAAALPALFLGREAIEYGPDAGDAQICVDVGGINGELPRTERWLCM